MSSVISKWVMPGIVTVVLGTVGTLFVQQGTIENDLIAKSTQAIDVAGVEDSKISFNARDGHISGIATDKAAVDAAIAKVATLHGVRSVVSDITIAPTASPYPFKAVLAKDGTIALSGAVPSYATRDALLEQTGGTDAGLELMSGAPQGDWLAATGFATSQLAGLDHGEANLSDLALSVQGVAKTTQAHDTTIAALAGELPQGLELSSAQIDYPFIEDYTFSATRTNGEISLSGYVPDEASRTKIGNMTGASTDALVLASGAPQSFVPSITYGLAALGHLENGELNVNNDDVSVSGSASNNAEFTMAKALLSAAPAGANVVLAQVTPPPAPAPVVVPVEEVEEVVEETTQAAEPVAPIVAPVPYFWSTQKRRDGSLTLRGFVPDESTRSALLTRAGADAIDRMQIQENAPATFYEDALVSISALKDLESGRAGYTRGNWYLTGQPETVADKAASQAALLTARTNASDWKVNLAAAPDVQPYTWTAEKLSAEKMVITGYVPNDDIRAAIMARAGEGAVDQMITANGAPEHFYEDALVAISAVKELEQGRAGNGGGGWYLAGQPATDEAKAAASGALLTARTMADEWNVALADAPLVPVVPYTWSVAKSADGALVVDGNVPDETTRAAIMARAGETATDHMTISYGAPEHFYEDALVAISAVKELEQGRAGNGGGGWYLAGQPATDEAKAAASGALLTARTMADEWNVALADAPLVPVVPYTWSVAKSADGALVVDGNVPDETTRAAIMARAGETATDHMTISYGAPEHFYEDALVAISASKELEEGRSGLSGSGWYLFGKTTTNEARDAATGALLTARTNADDWYVSIPELPKPVVEEVVEETAPPQPEINFDINFEANLSQENGIALSGMVPSNKSRIYLGQISGGVITSNLVVAPRGAPDNFAENARAGIRALYRLKEGRMAYENGTWSLVGKAESADARANALSQIDGLANFAEWHTDITLPTWAEICRTQIAGFVSENTIQFATDSAVITDDSLLTLQDLVVVLNQCPDSAVHVEGHTDSQGDFIYNLRLSNDRAEAVVTALAKFGIDKSRLYSIGFGEDRPIATNDTAEGRQANRRIVFKVLD